MASQTEIAAGAGDINDALLLEREHWVGGPPLELFKRMRGECPVHWTPQVSELPAAKGFWSVTRADDVHAVSRDWQTYSSELGGVEDDRAWADLMNTALAASDPDYSPSVDNVEETIQKAIEQTFARCNTMIAERRENPTDDLTSVLVHAEIDCQ